MSFPRKNPLKTDPARPYTGAPGFCRFIKFAKELQLCYTDDMGCPYFEIQKSEDYEIVASIIIEDTETKHFVRRRRYTPLGVNDDGIKSAFNKKIRRSHSGYFDGLRFFSIVFPLMIAVSI